MKNKRASIIAIIAVMVASMISNIWLSATPAYADGEISEGSVTDLTYYYGLKKCYEQGAFKTSIKGIRPSEFNWSKHMVSNKSVGFYPPSFGNSSNKGCHDIVKKLKPSGDADTVLKAFGYQGTNGQKSRCLKVNLVYGTAFDGQSGTSITGTTKNTSTNQICAYLDENNNITSLFTGSGGGGYITLSGSGGTITATYASNVEMSGFEITAGDTISYSKDGLVGQKFSALESAAKSVISTRVFNDSGSRVAVMINSGNPITAEAAKDTATDYELKTNPVYSDTFRSKFRLFNTPEIVYTYQRYIIRHGTYDCTEGANTGGTAVRLIGKDREYHDCLVNMKSGVTLYGFQSYGWPPITITLNDIVSTLNGTSLDGSQIAMLGEDGLVNVGTPPTPPGGSGSGTAGEPTNLDECMQMAGAMGWIFCPVLHMLKGTLQDIYGGAIEPMLQVDTGLVDRNNDTYGAWGAFRNIANLFFVILILLVIFSQVTGVGIDNYGIKRSLPKLIVTAVLVNFSFIICQLAVDVSNILGSGLNNLFTSAAGGGVNFSISGGGSVSAPAGSGFLSGLINGAFAFITAGAAGALALAVFTGPGIILSLLVSLLGVLVSVLFMFLSLGVRMVGIVILVVLSPIAFVAYGMPNTNSIFKKWFDLFKGLLLLYPICGALVGGGQFASSIVLNALATSSSSNDALKFFYTIIAMFVSVAPFFALPALMRKSIAAMGGVGAALSGLQGRLQGRVAGIRGTEAYKRGQVAMNASGLNRRYNIGKRLSTAGGEWKDAKGFRGRMASLAGAPLRAYGRGMTRSGARTANAYESMMSEQTKSSAALEDYVNKGVTDNELKNTLRRQAAAGDTAGMAVTQERMDRRGLAKDAASIMAEEVSKLNKISEGDPEQLRVLNSIKDALDQNSNISKMMATKEQDANMMLGNRGMLEVKGPNGETKLVQSNLSGFTRQFASGASADDAVALSSKAHARVAGAGGFNDAATQAIMSNPDHRAIIEGDAKKAAAFDVSLQNNMGGTMYQIRQASAQQSAAAREEVQQAARNINRHFGGGTPPPTA